MPSQTLANATIQDVEAALIEQYGRVNVTEKAMTPTDARWFFKITSKSFGSCSATSSSSGVTVTMEPATHTALWILTGIGYVCFILPGLAFTVFLLFSRFISGQVIKSRFPAMVENIERITQNRTVLKTPPLS